MSKKGMSPIISAVLLMAVTLSIAALFSGWGTQTAKDLFESTGNQTRETSACSAANMQIHSAVYNNNDLTVSLTVSGIDNLTNTQLRAWSDNDILMNSSDSFNAMKGRPVNRTFRVNSEPARVEAVSRMCEDISEETDEIG